MSEGLHHLVHRRKGFLDFLAAAKRIVAQKPDVRFLIVGDAAIIVASPGGFDACNSFLLHDDGRPAGVG